MNKHVNLSIFLILFLVSTLALAEEELVIVVNNENPIQQMTRSQVIDLFMGKYIAFPDGTKAIAVDLSSKQKMKKVFYKKLVGRSLASVNTYWSRILFTGRAKPTVKKETKEDIVQYIAKTKNAIGYIPKSMLNKNLKVVYNLDE
jgi:ABC-type phosphate transport system substrate-binding protein